ncbi:MAG: hypothetical protein KJO57_18240 [Deltaproteobacteria bacterium]|nr:hypothetical protein [Deltaproteobacteria bacterium]NNE17060.1 hypothetical protein [Myxococcales bacterium]NNK08662.1 hypothetical protein [Myxococcales bacterium]NNK43107.1 hypothetical protein [Myxococcales bacterium]
MRYLVGHVWLLALGVIPMVGCSDPEGSGGGGIATERSFASDDFQQIELSQRESTECVPNWKDQMVIDATVVRGAQGAASIEGIRLIEADGLVEQAFGPSPLSVDDVDSLQPLIAAVPTPPDLDGQGFCTEGGGGCDACLFTGLKVDDESQTWTSCCGEGDFTQSFLALVARIEELAP